MMEHLRTKYSQWQAQRQAKKVLTCSVKIENPKMKIKGEVFINCSRYLDVQSNMSFVAFLGIPYAAPLVEHLKFLPPQPLPSTNFRTKIRAYESNQSGRVENCLHLDVYVPKESIIKEVLELLPVLVYIHGGGFGPTKNTMTTIKPDNLMHHKLVVVKVRYRVEAEGFLNMGTEECQGNAGLKDQVKALQWIKLNIEKFGGDPNNVTICGHGAGATCVNLHLYSPLSKGLFKRAIIMSGGIYGPWGLKTKKETYNLRSLCSSYDFNTTTEAVKVLNGLRTNELHERINNWMEEEITINPLKSTFLFGPSQEEIREGAFLAEPIEQLMRKASPFSVMVGFTKNEGLLYFSTGGRKEWNNEKFISILTKTDQQTEFLQQNVNVEDEGERSLNFWMSQLERASQNCTTIENARKELTNVLTDLWYHKFYDNFRIGDEKLYVYEYDFQSEDRRRNAQDGPGLGDDLQLIFDPNYIDKIPDNKSFEAIDIRRVTNNLCALWANFCRDGNPRVKAFEWPAHTKENPYYIKIGTELRQLNRRVKDNPMRLDSDVIFI